MAAINNIAAGAPASRVQPLNLARPQKAQPLAGEAPTSRPSRGIDTVDLSEQARYTDALREGADVRVELVERIRAEIAAGTYETDEKLDQAVENLLDDLTD